MNTYLAAGIQWELTFIPRKANSARVFPADTARLSSRTKRTGDPRNLAGPYFVDRGTDGQGRFANRFQAHSTHFGLGNAIALQRFRVDFEAKAGSLG